MVLGWTRILLNLSISKALHLIQIIVSSFESLREPWLQRSVLLAGRIGVTVLCTLTFWVLCPWHCLKKIPAYSYPEKLRNVSHKQNKLEISYYIQVNVCQWEASIKEKHICEIMKSYLHRNMSDFKRENYIYSL